MGFFRASKPKKAAPILKAGRVDYRSLKKQARLGGTRSQPMTRAEERRAKALASARGGREISAAKSAMHQGVSENPLKEQLRHNLLQKRRGEAQTSGTSIARIGRHKEEGAAGKVAPKQAPAAKMPLMRRTYRALRRPKG